MRKTVSYKSCPGCLGTVERAALWLPGLVVGASRAGRVGFLELVPAGSPPAPGRSGCAVCTFCVSAPVTADLGEGTVCRGAVRVHGF